MLSIFKIIVSSVVFTSFIYGDSFSDIKTFQAQFSQIITNPSGKEAKYSGELFIKEPNSIKWEYKKPFEKLVYVKKYTVTIIEPELEQAIVTRLDKEINILSLLKTAKKITSSEYISKFNNVEYTLLFKNDILTDISYKDELENSINIHFTKLKQNLPIEDTIFKFSIPYEYDVIRK